MAKFGTSSYYVDRGRPLRRTAKPSSNRTGVGRMNLTFLTFLIGATRLVYRLASPPAVSPPSIV